ncbi:MAG: NADH:ubiquinone reductase (Na(+)-transporting) subunit C [Verrucomicrobia bacterium]|nr:NADH:ubiquinone reductase (Na(+)-transporting) subunit C [Verrucomicrobiota bacterium]
MSEPKPPSSNTSTVLFVVILCFACALILSFLATSLAPIQARSKELDIAKQQLTAAQIFNPEGYFQLQTESGTYEPGQWDPEKGMLVPDPNKKPASPADIYAVAKKRLIPYLTDAQGNVTTFEKAGINKDDYLAENAQKGYYALPEKLFFLILPNDPAAKKPIGAIIPLNGFGLWGPIYGYLAVANDGYTVIGTTWQGPAETPGLGAIIQEPSWQQQFSGKDIFLPAADGKPNLETAPLGIIVVKGKVSDVYGDTPRAHTAVDGITGATLTGNGVTAAFAESLAPYRPLLIKLHKSQGAIFDGS